MSNNLTDCVDCEKKISRNSTVCIHCGSNAPHLTQETADAIGRGVLLGLAIPILILVLLYINYEVL